jgi:hypothetical protein
MEGKPGVGKEYRVAVLMAIENLNWNEKTQSYDGDEDVAIANARVMWGKVSQVWTNRLSALVYAHDVHNDLEICEYGVQEIKIDRVF